MADHFRAELVMAAREMAPRNRRLQPGATHHPDDGHQFASIAFVYCCPDAGILPSMGSVGDRYDNAIAASFFAPLECELLDRRAFRTHALARTTIFAFIEGFSNTQRRHSVLDHSQRGRYQRPPK